MSYDHRALEAKWQKQWQEDGLFRAEANSSKESFYCLIEFPYPSGAGLHVGHPRSYTALDVIARKRRMEGYNVLYPIGWDAFGLPTENFAVKTGRKPQEITAENIATFRRQLQALGLSFDWSREVNTTDPAYYKWTQWMFLQFFKAGLAYKAKAEINWCPSCKIGLANEEAIGGVCERCGASVEKREKEQWMLAITKYAERLLTDLEEVNYAPAIKKQQQDWIGKSEGAEISFALTGIPGQEDGTHTVSVFTTRPDTIFGATFLVVSPELAKKWIAVGWQASEEVHAYINVALAREEMDRLAEGKEKTGVPTGIFAVNPANGEKIPVWIADYVLGHYGTGAIMAVPAHDERDRAFAEVFRLPISDAPLVSFEEALQKTGGQRSVKYKLRDWVFSRQRYWGEPIPLVQCSSGCAAEQGGWVSVPEDQLPVLLPDVEKYEPTDSGESPLATMTDWVTTTCPSCGGPATRETDTMPNWAGSSWYFLRYADPHNQEAFASAEALTYWMPVDWYNGGMEHTTLHLLYSRFWYKVLFDLGHIPSACGSEPYQKRTSHGLILASDGGKMSKSKGNVVNPDEMVEQYGADALRLYELFLGPFSEAVPWQTSGIVGVRRFLDRVFSLSKEVPEASSPELTALTHRLVSRVGEHVEQMRFNTAVSFLMEWVNAAEKQSLGRMEADMFFRVLSLFAPHMAEECWKELGQTEPVSLASWPVVDEALLEEQTATMVVQVNGKVRGSLVVAPELEEDAVQQAALELENVKKFLEGKQIAKIIFVPKRLINFVVQEST